MQYSRTRTSKQQSHHLILDRLLVSLGTPIINNIAFLKATVTGTTLRVGNWGACVGNRCSDTNLGFRLGDLLASLGADTSRVGRGFRRGQLFAFSTFERFHSETFYHRFDLCFGLASYCCWNGFRRFPIWYLQCEQNIFFFTSHSYSVFLAEPYHACLGLYHRFPSFVAHNHVCLTYHSMGKTAKETLSALAIDLALFIQARHEINDALPGALADFVMPNIRLNKTCARTGSPAELSNAMWMVTGAIVALLIASFTICCGGRGYFLRSNLHKADCGSLCLQ